MMALRVKNSLDVKRNAGMDMPKRKGSYKKMKEIAEDAESATTDDDPAI